MSDFIQDMFDSPSEVYSMDDEKLYGKVDYSMSYRQAVESGIVTEMKIHLLSVTSDDLEEVMESGDIDMNNDAGTDEVVLDTDGKKAMAVGSVAARKWFDDAVKSGIARKALAFFGRKANCRDAIDPNHPLCLIGDGIRGFEFHSGLSSRQRERVKSQFAASSEPALLASVRAIREGVSINDADTAILLRGYGKEDDGASVELIQHIGRVVRLAPGKEFANVVIPIPGVGSTNEIRERVLRLVIDLLNHLDIMPELVRVVESGGSLSVGTLREMGIEVHPSVSISEQDVLDGVEWTVFEHLKETNQPLYEKLKNGKSTEEEADEFLSV